ncbi:hypothetical protein JHK82_056413 [Glycine max]|uniref:Uncharacterized protein n=1 Tax=Glycine soja TaxID=3848 RepID=A0A445F567_GLYSO|nr:hypothetical protein JHK87_056503 [Glycine soja]KAG5077718.1 hypothetical protein JHK82_056413 [Glycine max]RZB43917.1 hypothetical protein D0Y65_054115 [Glycine soja]
MFPQILKQNPNVRIKTLAHMLCQTLEDTSSSLIMTCEECGLKNTFSDPLTSINKASKQRIKVQADKVLGENKHSILVL